MTTTSASDRQFVALNALRGVAALAVVQRHGYDFFGWPTLPSGYLAVDFFFLLSGWVLAHAYDRRLASTMSPFDFMRARLLRLYPVYALGLFLVLSVSLLSDQSPFIRLTVALLFLPNLWVPNFVWVIPASWSLTSELAINLPFGVLHRRLSTPVLLAVVLLGALALVLTAFVYGSLNAGHDFTNWPGGLARVLFDFPLGVLLYRHRDRLTRWAPRWATWPAVALLLVCMSVPAPGGVRPLVDLAIVIAALPALLLFAANAVPGRRTAMLATASGDLSYPIYILHDPLLNLAGIAFGEFLEIPLAAASPMEIAALMLGLVAISLSVDRWFDKPLRRRLSRPVGPAPAPTLAQT